jgi:hypothetical protein
MTEKETQKKDKNRFDTTKKIFGQDGILKDLFMDIHNDLNIEIVEDQDSPKIPEMFNIWIESRKKLEEKEKLDLIENLRKSYFCSPDEIPGFLYELENFGKIKIAVLPKIYASNFIKDLKFALKNQANILINLNEYSC